MAHRFEEIRGQLDRHEVFGQLAGTPYYRDAKYQRFSPGEMARRLKATRELMRRRGVEGLIAPGGPSHWSGGAGMRWLTDHREWHAMACYVVVPLEGDPTLVYSMGGTHCEATRRAVAVADVRHSRNGRFGDVMVDRLKELGLDRARIGITECDPRFHDYLPVNQYTALREGLPHATFEFLGGFFHELMVVKSPEEQACIRKAGALCVVALEAVIRRAAPGVTEEEVAAAAQAAILEGGGELDFVILGATSMAKPAMFFGNPRPSRRRLRRGDIIHNELAAAYRGYSAQIGMPVCVGEPPRAARRFFDDVALPGFRALEAVLRPGAPLEAMREAGQFFRKHEVQSRPLVLHGLDQVTAPPFVGVDRIEAEPYERTLRAGMTLMLEPNPITPDGMFGMFTGHTYLITERGADRVTPFPLELPVAGSPAGRGARAPGGAGRAAPRRRREGEERGSAQALRRGGTAGRVTPYPLGIPAEE
jgi:Xaa-Pro aminopeptidase